MQNAFSLFHVEFFRVYFTGLIFVSDMGKTGFGIFRCRSWRRKLLHVDIHSFYGTWFHQKAQKRRLFEIDVADRPSSVVS